mgnify:CR=1 FL=1
MSMTNNPYGLRAVNRNDGMPYAGATSQFLINPAGLASNLFFGQVVIINANGYIALSTATGADLTTNNLGGNVDGLVSLFAPPAQGRFWLRTADFWERFGRRFGPWLAGGVLMVEASKQVYAPTRGGLGAVVRRPLRVLEGVGKGVPEPAMTQGD